MIHDLAEFNSRLMEESKMFRATLYQTQCPFCARTVDRSSEESKDVAVTAALAGGKHNKTFGFYAHPDCILAILPPSLHNAFRTAILE